MGGEWWVGGWVVGGCSLAPRDGGGLSKNETLPRPFHTYMYQVLKNQPTAPRVPGILLYVLLHCCTLCCTAEYSSCLVDGWVEGGWWVVGALGGPWWVGGSFRTSESFFVRWEVELFFWYPSSLIRF